MRRILRAAASLMRQPAELMAYGALWLCTKAFSLYFVLKGEYEHAQYRARNC